MTSAGETTPLVTPLEKQHDRTRTAGLVALTGTRGDWMLFGVRETGGLTDSAWLNSARLVMGAAVGALAGVAGMYIPSCLLLMGSVRLTLSLE